jgi:hypothetical protein
MKKIFAIIAVAFAATVVVNAQNFSADVQESLNSQISRSNAAQSNGYMRKAVVNGQTYDVSWRNHTGIGVRVKAFADYTVGAFSPLGQVDFLYRAPKWEIYAFGAFSTVERNDADDKADERHNSYQFGGGGAFKIAEDKSGDFLGDWRLSLVGEIGWQSFEHTQSSEEFTLIDGTRNKVTFEETGGSLKGGFGLRLDWCISKAHAIYLGLEGLATYTNSPEIGAQNECFGGKGGISLTHVFGKTKYTQYGNVLKEAGALNARINAERKANSL